MANQRRQDRGSSSEAHVRGKAPKRHEGGGPGPAAAGDVRSVRLTRKLAEMIDGVDLRSAEVGDRLELSAREAKVLIAEGWAEPARRATDERSEARDESRQPSPGRRSTDRRRSTDP